MQAKDENQHMEELAQEYLEKLLQESAPASYLPMLAALAQEPALPVYIRVSIFVLTACDSQRWLCTTPCLMPWPVYVRVSNGCFDGLRVQSESSHKHHLFEMNSDDTVTMIFTRHSAPALYLPKLTALAWKQTLPASVTRSNACFARLQQSPPALHLPMLAAVFQTPNLLAYASE